MLDIGCGWGSVAKFAAERYGVEVLGVTLSYRQVEFGRKMCAGLPVELRLQDYRDVLGSFDRVVSLGVVGCFLGISWYDITGLPLWRKR